MSLPLHGLTHGILGRPDYTVHQRLRCLGHLGHRPVMARRRSPKGDPRWRARWPIDLSQKHAQYERHSVWIVVYYIVPTMAPDRAGKVRVIKRPLDSQGSDIRHMAVRERGRRSVRVGCWAFFDIYRSLYAVGYPIFLARWCWVYIM
jgi:hypothetical protein